MSFIAIIEIKNYTTTNFSPIIKPITKVYHNIQISFKLKEENCEKLQYLFVKILVEQLNFV